MTEKKVRMRVYASRRVHLPAEVRSELACEGMKGKKMQVTVYASRRIQIVLRKEYERLFDGSVQRYAGFLLGCKDGVLHEAMVQSKKQAESEIADR
jgi:hypothetical protein